MRPPSALGMTIGSPPSMTATTEFVVPRSMPMMRAHVWSCSLAVSSFGGRSSVVVLVAVVAGDGHEGRAAGRGRGWCSRAGAPAVTVPSGTSVVVLVGDGLLRARVEGLALAASMGVHALRLEERRAACGRWPRCPPPRAMPRASSGTCSMARSKSSASSSTLRSRRSLAQAGQRRRAPPRRGACRLAKSAAGALPAGLGLVGSRDGGLRAAPRAPRAAATCRPRRPRWCRARRCAPRRAAAAARGGPGAPGGVGLGWSGLAPRGAVRCDRSCVQVIHQLVHEAAARSGPWRWHADRPCGWVRGRRRRPMARSRRPYGARTSDTSCISTCAFSLPMKTRHVLRRRRAAARGRRGRRGPGAPRRRGAAAPSARTRARP